MHATADLWLFFLLVFGVVALPGMDMAYVAANAATGGPRAGAAAIGGIVAGGVLHVLVAATGIAAVLTAWPAAFDGLLLAGAVYMAWVGRGLWRSATSAGGRPTPAAAPSASQWRVFRRAVLTCLLNPKAYAFMLAVFPAFLVTRDHAFAWQAVRLSAVMAATQVGVYGVVVVLAVSRRRAAAAGQWAMWLPRAAGALLVVGAALTLVFGWKPLPRTSDAASGTPQAPLHIGLGSAQRVVRGVDMVSSGAV